MPFSYGNAFLKLRQCVTVLCIYVRLCLSSSQFCLRLRTNNGSANQYVLLMQVFSEAMLVGLYLLGNLPFFKIHANHFMAWDSSPCANVISECMLWVRGLGPVSEF